MRISLGLILGLKGAPHDRHHTHHEHHREKLDVTTEANIELSETTPKIPGKIKAVINVEPVELI